MLKSESDALDQKVCLCFHVSRRKLLNYLRIEKPLMSYDQVLWAIAGVFALMVLCLLAWRIHRRR